MTKKTCKSCQYWRDAGLLPGVPQDENWCSNSKSEHVRLAVKAGFSCDAFVKRGLKAPLWMRVANNGLSALNAKSAKKAKKGGE